MKKNIPVLIVFSIGFLIALFFYIQNEKETEKQTESEKFESEKTATDTTYLPDPFLTVKKEPPGTERYILNVDSSIVNWFISHHRGYVKFKNGYLSILKKELTGGVFYVAMDSIKDVDIDYPLMKTVLEKVLKSPEFFNTKKFPTSAFKIDSLQKISRNEYQVWGFMKIYDKIRKIKFKVKVKFRKSKIYAETDKFYIDRTKWGLTAYSKNYVQQDTSFVVPDSIGFIIKILAEKK